MLHIVIANMWPWTESIELANLREKLRNATNYTVKFYRGESDEFSKFHWLKSTGVKKDKLLKTAVN